MDEIIKDSRFSHIVKDPRFRRIPKREKKVKIDKRFQSMFHDKKFKVKYIVDKRGRPIDHTSNEDLKQYYALSSEESDSSDNVSDEEVEDIKKLTKKESTSEELLNDKTVSGKSKSESKFRNGTMKDCSRVEFQEEGEKNNEEDKNLNELLTDRVKEKLRDMKVDYARGEGILFSESSSDEESSESGDSEEELEHGWGELDHDAEQTDKATNRLAVCHMDWDKIRAVDLMVLLNSFLHKGGIIHSVTIYPSDFGLQRMKEEEIKGPIELTANTANSVAGETENEEENEEGSKFHMEKLRQYQLNRLKYFYAVVVCDSAATAEKIYNECDGLEYESSATKMDLRFVPDDTVFDQEPRETCDILPDLAKYRPRYFTTTALQQAKVELTWDETNPERQELTKKLMSGQVDGVSDADLKAYLASSSSEESDDSEEKTLEKDDTGSQNKEDAFSKYRELLEEIKAKEENKKSQELEMEVTWGLGLKDKTEKLVKKKLQDNKNLTPFQQFLEKRKEKRKQKREEKKIQLAQQKGSASDKEFSDDYIPSDIDMNDAYFREEFEGMTKTKKKKKHENKANESDNEEARQNKAELELLLMGESDANHFSLKSIQEQETENKKKKKKTKNEAQPEKEDNFQVNVNDERFSALFSSHHFNIDPTDPHYRKTKGMEILRSEKLKRRNCDEGKDIRNVMPNKIPKKELEPELSVLVKSVKRKTKTLNK